jgi:putative nucleotidyltransferase with HDIG domain
VESFKGFTDLAAVAISKSNTYERLAQGFHQGVQALAHTIELSDPYTAGHSDRVTKYAVLLARRMGATREQLKKLWFGGQLHDIGKAGVWAIVQKPGKLEPEERKQMEMHPVYGYETAKKFCDDQGILAVIRSHHERPDGKGYPDGLTAQTMSPLAKIAAVADAFDAMTSDRPYRKGMPQEVAMSRLAAEPANTQHDEEAFRTFATMAAQDHLATRITQEDFSL